MKIKITVLAVLLLTTCWVLAQDTTNTTPPTGASVVQNPPIQNGSSSNQSDTNQATSVQPAQNQTAPETSASVSDRSGAAGQSKPGSATGQSGMAGSATMLRGCLSVPPAGGIFILTEDLTGTRYNLTGDTDVLRMLVGSEVQVTGQFLASFAGTSPGDNVNSSTGETDSSGAPAPGSGAGTSHSFQVSSATKVFDHCGAGSPSPTALWVKTGGFELAAGMTQKMGKLVAPPALLVPGLERHSKADC